MATLIRAAILAFGLIAVAAGLIAGPAGAAAGGAAPLTATLSLQPSRAHVGERVTAVATVAFDGDAIDPDAVRAVGSFGALDVLSGPVVERSKRDGQTVLQFRWEVACLTQDCVPAATTRTLSLPPLRLQATRTGTSVRATADWPQLSIVSRVSARQAGAATPPFRLETELPAASYRVAPRTLELALGVSAAALLLALVILIGQVAASRRTRLEERRLALMSPLERALLFAREAERRGPADRRRALSLLARVLGGSGSPVAPGGEAAVGERELGDTVSGLAWGPPEPTPTQIASVVDEVEREVGKQ